MHEVVVPPMHSEVGGAASVELGRSQDVDLDLDLRQEVFVRLLRALRADACQCADQVLLRRPDRPLRRVCTMLVGLDELQLDRRIASTEELLKCD